MPYQDNYSKALFTGWRRRVSTWSVSVVLIIDTKSVISRSAHAPYLLSHVSEHADNRFGLVGPGGVAPKTVHPTAPFPQQKCNLWRACNLTAFIYSSTGPVVHPFASRHEGPRFNPQGVLMWNWDSPVSVVSLHWWPRCHWSLWPRLRWASSQTVTRLSCRQCDNPAWSHTALLSRFHPRCRSSFRLHNQHSQLLGGSPVESLQSHCIHTQFHWSSGLLVCFLSWGTWVQSPGGYLCGTGILLLALSGYKPQYTLEIHMQFGRELGICYLSLFPEQDIYHRCYCSSYVTLGKHLNTTERVFW